MAIVLVVSDTGPIQYLTLLGRIELLAHFFGEVLVPSAVLQELSHPSTPQPIRDFIRRLPPWIKEVPCSETNPKFDGFGIGEREALTVAFPPSGIGLALR